MNRLPVSLFAFALLLTAAPHLSLAAESTATYAVGNLCTGQVPACEPAQDFNVTTDGVLRAEVAVSFTCIATTVQFSVDGGLLSTSAPVPAGGSTGVVDLGPVTPGTHTLTIAAEVPLAVECDTRSWIGTLAVTTAGVSDDDVAFANPGDVVTVSTLVAGTPRPAGISATLFHAGSASATARIAVATFGGPLVGFPPDPYQPGDPYRPGDPYHSAGYLDLQLTGGDVADVIEGVFSPGEPYIPNDPTIPIRLAYLAGNVWSPVFGPLQAGSPPTLPAYDSALKVFSVTFDNTSTPRVTALNGTVFGIFSNLFFRGFGFPVDAATLNVAKAGRAIPLKWQVFDGTTAPLLDLDPAVVKVSTVVISCESGDEQTDVLEEYAVGTSGLQNLGAGTYQLNWNTPKSYAGSCRRLRLDLGERNPDGSVIYRTADFQFTR